MAVFTHYLVTRYNISIQGWETDKAGQATKDRTWLEHRAALFSKYCAPTVLGQEEKNFTWLLYFNVQTPADYLKEIENKLTSIKYQVRLVSSFQECLDDLKNIISSSSTPYTITSRLDNDDGIGKYFIRDVQQAFVEEHQTLVILEAGIVYDMDLKVLTRIPHHKKNHYGSLIEKSQPKENLTTILGFAHDKQHPFKTVFIDKPNSWLKIIHNRNLKSQLYGVPAHPKSILPFYTIDDRLIKVSAINSLSYIFSRTVKKIRHKIFRRT